MNFGTCILVLSLLFVAEFYPVLPRPSYSGKGTTEQAPMWSFWTLQHYKLVSAPSNQSPFSSFENNIRIGLFAKQLEEKSCREGSLHVAHSLPIIRGAWNLSRFSPKLWIFEEVSYRDTLSLTTMDNHDGFCRDLLESFITADSLCGLSVCTSLKKFSINSVTISYKRSEINDTSFLEEVKKWIFTPSMGITL